MPPTKPMIEAINLYAIDGMYMQHSHPQRESRHTSYFGETLTSSRWEEARGGVTISSPEDIAKGLVGGGGLVCIPKRDSHRFRIISEEPKVQTETPRRFGINCVLNNSEGTYERFKVRALTPDELDRFETEFARRFLQR